MNVNIIYDSKYGNGEKLCKYVKNALEEKEHDAGLYFVRDIKVKDLPRADFYTISAPTHIGSAPWKVKRYIKKISDEGAKYTLITTCLDEESKAIEKMRKKLSGTGLKEVGDGLRIKVEGMKGPLEEGYKEKVDDYLDEILSEM